MKTKHQTIDIKLNTAKLTSTKVIRKTKCINACVNCCAGCKLK
ncbi:hypothetical protein SPONN_2716 [uncultured Candidatus Thioglobus sp.]|nr:hypothetical protein SPONN_2716 [uncultured Candidatus Thioglobus sp.]SMN01937.1 hypothetical protein SPONL_267 [uncultured Candidatus Thioglobus sp.]